jgi:tetratricopeptide (TPR) repeat protein
MKNVTIEELAYILKQAKKHNQPKPIFFLGDGASKSGNIPLASEIIEDILDNYSESPAIKKLEAKDRSYSKLMECLQPYERDKLLKDYIDKAKINVTHIYLAQLMFKGYVDYVLTVNFDNLMLRALSLFNIFPSTYDMAILKDLTTTTFKEKSVVYLHGQHHGLWLLNTKEEMEKVNATVPRIFDSIKNKRPWIFIGYSGNDPIFEHVKNLGRFDNGLIWVTYNNDNPNERVKIFLKKPNTNASLIKGYDSDSFMLKLNTELDLDQPQVINKPFTCIREMLDNIVDIDDDEHFKGIKERLEIAKKQVDDAINQFEKGKIGSNKKMIRKSSIDILKKEIINLIINHEYDEEKIGRIVNKAENEFDKELDNLLAMLHSNWGNYLGNLAQIKDEKKSELLYQQAFEKFRKAIELKPDYHEAFYNWGNDLDDFANSKKGKEAEVLYQQAFEKFQKAIEIKPDEYQAFCNWGISLGNLARIKKGKEVEVLYQQAFEKFQKAIEIKPDFHPPYYNWGAYLIALAKTKEGNDTQELYKMAYEKSHLALKYGCESYYFSCSLALIGKKEEALKYLNISLAKNEIEVDFVEKDEDWKDYLKDEDFIKLIKKYKK